jgi:hypothetical protein
VVELGRLLSRPLWLASRYQERVRIGKYVEEAAARLNRYRERAAALVDDIGWTAVVLGDLDRGRVFIRDGFNLAKQRKLFAIAGKAARHLASISRRQAKFKEAAHWLNEGEKQCAFVTNANEKFELENRLRLSRAKLEAATGKLPEALALVHTARVAFKAAGEVEGPRYAETFLLEAEVLEREGQLAKATIVSAEGYNQALRFGRRDEAVLNALFLERTMLQLEQKLQAQEWRKIAVALATEIGFPLPNELLARIVEEID